MLIDPRSAIDPAVLSGFAAAELGQPLILRVTRIQGLLSVTYSIATVDAKGVIRATQFVIDDTAIYKANTPALLADLQRRTMIAAKRVANLVLRPAAGDTSTIVSSAGSTPLLTLTTEVQ